MPTFEYPGDPRARPPRRHAVSSKLTGDFVQTFEARGRTFLEVAARGADAADPDGDARHRAPAAAGPPRAAARDPRRPGGLGQRSVRRARAAQEREHRRRRRAAGLPGHRHRDRHGQEGPARADRRATTSEAISRGVFDTYTEANLRYSQVAPLDMFEEKNTGNNLPAQIELYATDGDEYHFLFMAKGGGSANKSLLFQETKALLNPKSLDRVPRPEAALARHRRVPAVPPRGRDRRHQRGADAQGREARVGALPRRPADQRQRARARVPRPRVGAARSLEIARSTGIGAQFGGKYFCHDVRVIRLPRHGASCPVALAVSAARPIARRSARSRATACSSSSSRPIRRSTCPSPPTPSSRARS